MVEALLTRPIGETAASKEIVPKEETFKVIQGGMGAGVSNWELARAVAIAGEKLNEPVLGVVSGTGLPTIMIDRLKHGDNNAKSGLEAFDAAIGLGIGGKIIQKYYASDKPRNALKPEVIVTGNERQRNEEIDNAVASAFAEVWLAKQGHSGPIGINLLEKIQLMHLPTILGAMLADVDYVLIGAGVPNQIPKLLSDFANGEIASYKLDVKGLKDGLTMKLDPKRFMSGKEKLKKPKFYPIISLDILARRLNRIDGVDGFIIEGPSAGGHNAPPRDRGKFNGDGEPIYGEGDIPNLSEMRRLGKPFYLAGGYGTPEKLKEAQELGATGVQIGTVFALSEESGIRKDYKQLMKRKAAEEMLAVKTSPRVSPSSFPFQVVQLEKTISDKNFPERDDLCDLGYLVEAYQRHEGEAGRGVGFRCPSEPEDKYLRKGGKIEDTEGRVCLCNALIDAVNPDGKFPIFTLGKDLDPVRTLMKEERNGNYTAEDVIRHMASHSPK